MEHGYAPINGDWPTAEEAHFLVHCGCCGREGVVVVRRKRAARKSKSYTQPERGRVAVGGDGDKGI